MDFDSAAAAAHLSSSSCVGSSLPLSPVASSNRLQNSRHRGMTVSNHYPAFCTAATAY